MAFTTTTAPPSPLVKVQAHWRIRRQFPAGSPRNALPTGMGRAPRGNPDSTLHDQAPSCRHHPVRVPPPYLPCRGHRRRATSQTTGSIQFTEDITFTITTAGFAQQMVFDNWVTSDGVLDDSLLIPDVYYSLNGGTPVQLATALYDNLATTYGDMTPNDGYLFHNSIAVEVGDTLTIKQGTYTLKEAALNPGITQTFTGNMFITNPNGITISTTAVVPEPTVLTLCLCGAGLATLASARRLRISKA